jgi:hypothetical protein
LCDAPPSPTCPIWRSGYGKAPRKLLTMKNSGPCCCPVIRVSFTHRERSGQRRQCHSPATCTRSGAVGGIAPRRQIRQCEQPAEVDVVIRSHVRGLRKPQRCEWYQSRPGMSWLLTSPYMGGACTGNSCEPSALRPNRRRSSKAVAGCMCIEQHERWAMQSFHCRFMGENSHVVFRAYVDAEDLGTAKHAGELATS